MAVQAIPLPLVVFGLLIPFALYRRVRMNIGKQKLEPRRLKLRSVVMLIVLSVIAGPAVLDARLDAVAGLLGGALGGLAIAWFALRHTKFFDESGVEFYEPHPYIGLALISLLLGRLGWRLWQNWPAMTQPGGAPPMPLSAMTPLTLAVFGLIVTYNVAFSVGLLLHTAKRPQ